MNPADDDAERLLEPQEEADEERKDHVQSLQDEEREEEDAEADFEEELPEDRAGHYADVLELANGIFRGDEVDLEEAEGLSADERAALRVLAEAVRGKDLDDEGDMIYAEERLTMLNLALAVLQPVLALGLAPELVELRSSYDALVEEVTDLREKLERLGDAQEEMFEQDREAAKDEGGDTDDDDEDESQAEKDRRMAEQRAAARPTSAVPEPGEPARPSTLAGKPGEPAVEQPARPSAVAGKPSEPAVQQPPRPSTLAGKAGEPAVQQPARPSTAYDGDK